MLEGIVLSQFPDATVTVLKIRIILSPAVRADTHSPIGLSAGCIGVAIPNGGRLECFCFVDIRIVGFVFLVALSAEVSKDECDEEIDDEKEEKQLQQLRFHVCYYQSQVLTCPDKRLDPWLKSSSKL